MLELTVGINSRKDLRLLLLASFAYYILDYSILSDSDYDKLAASCKKIDPKELDKDHKKLYNLLKRNRFFTDNTSTLFNVKWSSYPTRLRLAAGMFKEQQTRARVV